MATMRVLPLLGDGGTGNLRRIVQFEQFARRTARLFSPRSRRTKAAITPKEAAKAQWLNARAPAVSR